jgi:hypothetical protein
MHVAAVCHNRREVEVGRTEVVRDCLNPEFITGVLVAPRSDDHQLITIRLYDEDKKGVADLSKHEFIGEATLALQGLVAAPSQRSAVSLTHPKRARNGSLTVFAELLTDNRGDELSVTISGQKLPNNDGMMGKSDPYYVMKKGRRDGSWITVYKSEVVMVSRLGVPSSLFALCEATDSM